MATIGCRTVVEIGDCNRQCVQGLRGMNIDDRPTTDLLTLLTDQRKLLLWLQIRRSDDAVL